MRGVETQFKAMTEALKDIGTFCWSGWRANFRENSSTFRGVTAETGRRTELAGGERKRYKMNNKAVQTLLTAKYIVK